MHKMVLKVKQQPQLDTQEAFNLWDMLKVRYDWTEMLHIFKNFIHDPDFLLLIDRLMLKPMQQQTNELEKLMDQLKINLPRRPPKSVRTPANVEAVEDRFIMKLLLTQLQENIDMHMRAIQTSLTNKKIRVMFIKFLIDELDVFDSVVKYSKLKAWVGTPPSYPLHPPGTKETLASGEAFHLWDHLGARYDTLEITQIYQHYAKDPDLSVVLSQGIRTSLEKQINLLEAEMDHFGLPLPERPPKSVRPPENAEVIEDRLMFRNIFTGMQFMFQLHGTALKQTTTNDRLRNIFVKFLREEIDLFDKLTKYGKLKGWLRPTPLYPNV